MYSHFSRFSRSSGNPDNISNSHKSSRLTLLTTASYDVNFGFRSGAVNVIKAPLLPIVSLKRSNSELE